MQNLEVNIPQYKESTCFIYLCSSFECFNGKNVRFRLVVLRNMLIFAPVFIPVTYKVTGLLSANCIPNRIPDKINNPFICFIYFFILKRFQISLRHRNGRVPHRFGNDARMNFTIIRCCSPCMTGGVSNIQKCNKKQNDDN